jgi:UDP-N-acetylglucosamine acyltransferase
MNEIHHTCIIGEKGQIKGRDDNNIRAVNLGDQNIIRAFTTIDEGVTLGNNIFIMSHCHLGHDCKIQDDVIISEGSTLCGHVNVLKGANLGVQSSFHQFVTVGHYAMVGMGSVVIEDVPPFTKVVGNPARIIGYNTVGMKRAGFTDSEIEKIVKDYPMNEYLEEFNALHKRKFIKWGSKK